MLLDWLKGSCSERQMTNLNDCQMKDLGLEVGRLPDHAGWRFGRVRCVELVSKSRIGRRDLAH